MATITATTARQTLPAQLDRVEAGEEISITRHGHIVAVLVSPTSLRERRAPDALRHADQLAQRLEQARTDPIRPAALTTERAEDLVEAVRTDRHSR
ncbi:MAG: type II toxin-antitoxin system Phd/YefM family antitoxin [Acidipropionibacterium sp.]|jgi:prevent-host-death family protein|nr:type II toxin-antitoxin system Phd/YefM family antitoxin [Acidipropionibacterium sp.]